MFWLIKNIINSDWCVNKILKKYKKLIKLINRKNVIC